MFQAPDPMRLVILPVHDAAVAGQIRQAGGHAMPFQIARRRAQQAPVRHDAARDQALVGQLAEADRQIDAVRDEVHRAVGDVELHLHLRIALREGGHQRRNRRAPETERCIHPQQAARHGARARYGFFHLVQVGQDARRVVQIGFALGREAAGARGAVHEPHAKTLFELRQALGGGRRREVERACRGAQAAVAGQQHKEFEMRGEVIIHFG